MSRTPVTHATLLRHSGVYAMAKARRNPLMSLGLVLFLGILVYLFIATAALPLAGKMKDLMRTLQNAGIRHAAPHLFIFTNALIAALIVQPVLMQIKKSLSHSELLRSALFLSRDYRLIVSFLHLMAGLMILLTFAFLSPICLLPFLAVGSALSPLAYCLFYACLFATTLTGISLLFAMQMALRNTPYARATDVLFKLTFLLAIPITLFLTFPKLSKPSDTAPLAWVATSLQEARRLLQHPLGPWIFLATLTSALVICLLMIRWAARSLKQQGDAA